MKAHHILNSIQEMVNVILQGIICIQFSVSKYFNVLSFFTTNAGCLVGFLFLYLSFLTNRLVTSG